MTLHVRPVAWFVSAIDLAERYSSARDRLTAAQLSR
jgi:hypothetical protein